MITAAYCRFSSDQQRDSSIEDQLRNCRAWCARNGMPAPVVYQDAAISGARQDRPGYLKMLAAAERGEFDVLVVDDLSRLSRDQLETGRAVRMLRHWGVRLVGVSDGVDTDRKGHKVEVGLRGLMSELYLDDLAEKTHRGLMGKALQGLSAGGLPYGYRVVDAGDGSRREIVSEQAAVVVRIYQRFAAGHSPRAIAADLNADRMPSPRGSTWALSAIYGDIKRGIGILANPIYIGRQIWNRSKWQKDPRTGRRLRVERPPEEWVIHDDESLRIVPQELWDAAQERIKATRAKTARLQKMQGELARAGRGPKFLFSGLLRCGECGGPMVVVDRYRYGCAIHKDRGPAACGNGVKVAREVVEIRLLEAVKQDLASEDAYRAFEAEVHRLLNESRPDPAEARRTLQQAEKERDNIMTAIRSGIITPSTKQALETAEAAMTEARRRLDAMTTGHAVQIIPRLREIWRQQVAKLEQIEDVPAAREALKSLLGEEIRLVPEDGILVAEMQTGAFGACQINLVAGAGFEPTTFGL